MVLVTILSTLLIAVLLFYDTQKEECKKHAKKEEQLQEYLSSTHKTFAEQELEELKQKYDIEDVSQKESLIERSKEAQMISLDIHIENGKITSITEVDTKTESNMQKSRLTDNEVLNNAFKSMYI